MKQETIKAFKEAALLACTWAVGTGLADVVYDALAHADIDPARIILKSAFVGLAMIPLYMWMKRKPNAPAGPQ